MIYVFMIYLILFEIIPNLNSIQFGDRITVYLLQIYNHFMYSCFDKVMRINLYFHRTGNRFNILRPRGTKEKNTES